MKTTSLILFALCLGVSARADFSYSTVSTAGGPHIEPTKYFLKGQKIMVQMNGPSHKTVIIDFDAQTMTGIDNSEKTYTVTKFSDFGQKTAALGDVQVEMKETGAKKVIDGFNCHQVVMTMVMDMSQQRPGMKMQMEMEVWASPDVPGAPELRAFYERNSAKMPWTALAQGANGGTQQAFADMQRKMTQIKGVPVQQIIRVKPAGDAAQAAQMQQGMAAARARLEEMAKQGGPQAQAAQQALARMGAAAGGGALMEMTTQSKDFSTASIPDSAFAIPAGYKQVEK